MRRCFALCVFPLLMASQGYGREPNPALHADIAMALGFSYTGYNISVLLPLQLDRHTAYIGPKLILSDSYIPYRNIWGIHAGYDYCVLKKDAWQADAGMDMQWSFYRPFSIAGVNRTNNLREMYLMLGLSWQVLPNIPLRLKLQLGSGLYADTWYDLVDGNKRSAMGRTSTGRFVVTYKLF